MLFLRLNSLAVRIAFIAGACVASPVPAWSQTADPWFQNGATRAVPMAGTGASFGPVTSTGPAAYPGPGMYPAQGMYPGTGTYPGQGPAAGFATAYGGNPGGIGFSPVAAPGGFEPHAGGDPTLGFTICDENSYNGSLTVDALILGRSLPGAGVIAVDGNQAVVLDAGDITLGAQVAPRVSFLLGGRKTGIEFSFFGVNDHSFFGRFNQPGVTPIFFGGIPADPVESYDIHYQGRLNSAEVNFWRGFSEQFRGGIGIRGIGLAESFDILQTGEGTTGFFSSGNNDLIGLQLGGGLGLFRSRRFDVDATLKTGVFLLDYELNAIAENESLSVDDDAVRSVSELDVGATYHFGRHFSIRGGYFALWLVDVALAIDQSSSFNMFQDAGEFNYGTAVYQGGYFGFECRW